VQERLGLTFNTFDGQAISVSDILAQSKQIREGPQDDEIQQIKETIYNRIVESVEGQGDPTEASPDFDVTNIHHLVYAMVNPLISAFTRKTGKKLLFQPGKAITAVSSNSKGYLETVSADMIGLKNQEFILIVETQSDSLGVAKRQCLLVMQDMRENDSTFGVYGFVTTGEFWQMLNFDGGVFTPAEILQVLFATMTQDKARWMEEAGIVVDCLHLALRSGVISSN